MTTTAWVTIGVVAMAALVLVGYDVWVIVKYGSEASISRWVWMMGRSHPITAFGLGLVVGVLAGHFWWPQG